MSDKTSETIEEYAEAHTSPEPEHLHRLVRSANLHLVNGRMCSGHQQGRLLAMLTAMARPRRVLELGTFAAYSALCIAEALADDARLLTIEHNDELEDFIRARLAESPHGHKVEPLFGDALELMADMEDASFDLIFIDADKRQYPAYYRQAMRLLAPGGTILADNTLWDGHVADIAYERDPQTRGIREFNELVAADTETWQVVLPLRDGLTIIRRR